MDDVAGSEKVEEYMLTTVDNPFDPFEQFDQWLAFDISQGYNTPGLLARVTIISDDLSEVDQFLAVQEAINEIVRENVLGIHRKLKRGQLAAMNS